MRVTKITSLFSLIFLLSFFLILPSSLAEIFEITLHKGWNAISIPYENFIVVKIDKDIYPDGYVYETGTSSYRVVSLYSLSKQEGAIWIYSFKEGSKITIDGWNPTAFYQILSKKIYTSAQKPTWNFITVPKGNLRTNDLKSICENIRIYHFNASDNCWYSYNISSKEYKRFCKDKWEDLGISEDLEYPEGIGIWLKLDKSCHSNFFAQASNYQKSCESDKVRGQPDDEKCDDGEACMLVSTSTSSGQTVNVWKCISCEELNQLYPDQNELAEECKPEKHPKCGLQTKISEGKEIKFCTAASKSSLIRCGDRDCEQGEKCCVWKTSLLGLNLWWNYECYNPQYFGCGDNGIKCIDSTCDSLCRSNNLGMGSCSKSTSTPAYNEFTIDGKKVACYCEKYPPSRCKIGEPKLDLTYSISPDELPKQFTLSKDLSISFECSNVVFKIVKDDVEKRVVYSTPTLPDSNFNICERIPNWQYWRPCYVTFSFPITELPSKFLIQADKDGGVTENLGTITFKKSNEIVFKLQLEPSKTTYKIGETATLRLKGYTDYQIGFLELEGWDKTSGSKYSYAISGSSILPGTIDRIIESIKFTWESREYCFKVKGRVLYDQREIETPPLCVEIRGVATTSTTTTSSTTSTTTTTPSCKGENEYCSSGNECCSGLRCIPDASGITYCRDPSKFRCQNGDLYYVDKRLGGCLYCCSDSNACGGLSACCKKNEAECKGGTTSTTSTTSTTLTTSTTTTTTPSSCSDINGACLSIKLCKNLGGTCNEDKLGCAECCCIDYKALARPILSTSLNLKSGWNLISFPFVDYVISQMKDVHPYVYTYNPITSSYEQIDIAKASGKGFWVYASKDTAIEIMGTQSLYPENISLVANKPNLIPIPKDGLKVISQKGNCKITKFYYYNSTDQTWYRWNATNGEYSKFNYEKKLYELVKIDKDPFIPEGLAIFIYTENDCRLSS